MKEYIDREALLQDIKETVVYTARPDRENLIGRGVQLVLNRIAAAPAADVAPVVHGEWISIVDYGGGKCIYFCSRCMTYHQAESLTALKQFQRYCRWCGARMDGGKTK